MNDLDRIKKLAGIITESVSVVPGLGNQKQEPNEIDQMFDSNAQHTGMEESSIVEDDNDQHVQQNIQRVQELVDSGEDPYDAVNIIWHELKSKGLAYDEIVGIIDSVAEHFELDTGDEESNNEEELDDTCPTCTGTGEGMYDGASCSSCGGSGVIKPQQDPDDFVEPDGYEEPWDGPLEEAEEAEVDDAEEVEEAFDLNNGYDDVKFAKGSDYFPDGADSPVVKTTGAAGAHQGDNPEQKKMAVAETHKELVYNYRKFLKESAKK